MPAATTTVSEANPFIKQLASSSEYKSYDSIQYIILSNADRKIRDAAFSSLQTYLQRSTAFSDLEFLKLWKGLFFCMWMSDKPLTQQRLARDLADLVHVLKGRDNFLGFVKAFWTTMAREWGGIDALRMDKFLYLVRCYVNQGFVRVSRQQWSDEELLDDYLEILSAWPLNVKDPKIPNGLRFHVIDIYVDELDTADSKQQAPLDKVLDPLRNLGKHSMTRAIRERVKEALADERLSDWQAPRSQNVEGDGEHTVNRPGILASSANEVQDGSSENNEEDEDDFGGFDD